MVGALVLELAQGRLGRPEGLQETRESTSVWVEVEVEVEVEIAKWVENSKGTK